MRFMADKITMGWNGESHVYQGLWNTKEEALSYVRENYRNFQEIDEGYIFFQKIETGGNRVIEIYIQDIDDEDFLQTIEMQKYLGDPYFKESSLQIVHPL